MTKNRKTEKKVEIHEFYVMRSTSGSLPVLCSKCSESDAIMLAPEQASILAQVPLRMIYRWVETASVHYQETPNGSLLVCFKSLPITREDATEDRLLSD